jgi:hypothetical protein
MNIYKNMFNYESLLEELSLLPASTAPAEPLLQSISPQKEQSIPKIKVL